MTFIVRISSQKTEMTVKFTRKGDRTRAFLDISGD